MAYKEGSESTFTHFGKEYLVDDLIALTKNKPLKTLAVSKLAWIFEYSTPTPERAEHAHLQYPIIVTKDFVDDKEVYIVLDGLHRLDKAIKLGKQYIDCFILDKHEVKALTEVKHK